ncbi:hypothetical protein [Spirosoma utsteinense]|uniref:Auto-transporter adhesin head GIN domain-containing protein n=1 Tax=Spirosoma utsteinense TaxID=2585773 RepID=A0ABR6WC67_9BACT|nr:hypothetical protein [Spirosoma utsteinense]MBC3784001.1 hypothetical protein [Spirosoma utsteinense]MBC3793511.1 hypothetical protein [Spirosoma utsteinense]
MKTSHILLGIITIVTLTGMVATDVLLKQQFDKLDWSNPNQDFERRPLPTASHLVIDASPAAEIVVEGNVKTATALVNPAYGLLYHTRQQGDTLFITFTPDYEGEHQPRNDAFHELGVGLLLQLPTVRSLRITNGRLTLKHVSTPDLALSLRNTRLRTNHMTVSGPLSLSISQHSFAVLGTDRYQSLRLVVQDSSGVQLNNTDYETFLPTISPNAEVALSGQALRWLAK